MTTAFERRLAAAEAKLPRPQDEGLTELEQWLATLSDDALEWLEHEYRVRADADPTGAPISDEEWRTMAEITVAISEQRLCPIGSDPVSPRNWRWRRAAGSPQQGRAPAVRPRPDVQGPDPADPEQPQRRAHRALLARPAHLDALLGPWAGRSGAGRPLEAAAHAPHLPKMAPKPYYRRWQVYLREERLGEVLAATERAACLRAVQRFKIITEDQRELNVRRVEDDAPIL